MFATNHTHLTLQDLIALISGEEYRLWSSSPWNFLQHTVTSSHQNVLLRTMFSNTLLHLEWEIKFHTHTKQLKNPLWIMNYSILLSHLRVCTSSYITAHRFLLPTYLRLQSLRSRVRLTQFPSTMAPDLPTVGVDDLRHATYRAQPSQCSWSPYNGSPLSNFPIFITTG